MEAHLVDAPSSAATPKEYPCTMLMSFLAPSGTAVAKLAAASPPRVANMLDSLWQEPESFVIASPSVPAAKDGSATARAARLAAACGSGALVKSIALRGEHLLDINACA